MTIDKKLEIRVEVREESLQNRLVGTTLAEISQEGRYHFNFNSPQEPDSCRDGTCGGYDVESRGRSGETSWYHVHRYSRSGAPW